MKKNRIKEKDSFSMHDLLYKKSSSENIQVFLVIATIILVVSFYSSYRHLLQQKVLSAPEKEVSKKYVWLTSSPEIAEGLYQFSPGQLEKDFPEMHSLLSAQSEHEINPLVSAVHIDPETPRIIELPPKVANIFFQPIPINLADEIILTSLPGIGPVLAQKIVQRRNQHGPFRSKKELLQIAGIGPKKLAGLIDHIIID
jgi:hypothetical protein